MHRNHWDRLGAVLLALEFVVVPFTAHAASFTGIGFASPGQLFISNANGVSADGSTVTGVYSAPGGSFYSDAFRWTATSGLQPLVELSAGPTASGGYAVSADGSVIVGISGEIRDQQAFRWTASGGMQGIGGLPGDNYAIGSAVSGDGAVVVGNSGVHTAGTDSLLHAFRWTEGDGMQALGTLPGMAGSYASGISADGATVVGAALDGPQAAVAEAYRWTASEGMQSLGDLPGGITYSDATAISGDGSVIVGTSASANSSREAFVWDAVIGMRGIGSLPGGASSSLALGVSGDGSVIVGSSGSWPSLTAFIWTAEHGMRDLRVVLQTLGIDMDGWVLQEASGVSADGTVIVGFGINPAGQQQGWVAVIPEPTPAVAVGLGLVLLAWRRRSVRATRTVE